MLAGSSIGTVYLKGDEAGPLTIRLQPWGTITGRVVDDEGQPLKGLADHEHRRDRSRSGPTCKASCPSDGPDRQRRPVSRRALVPGLKYGATASDRAQAHRRAVPRRDRRARRGQGPGGFEGRPAQTRSVKGGAWPPDQDSREIRGRCGIMSPIEGLDVSPACCAIGRSRPRSSATRRKVWRGSQPHDESRSFPGRPDSGHDRRRGAGRRSRAELRAGRVDRDGGCHGPGDPGPKRGCRQPEEARPRPPGAEGIPPRIRGRSRRARPTRWSGGGSARMSSRRGSAAGAWGASTAPPGSRTSGKRSPSS